MARTDLSHFLLPSLPAKQPFSITSREKTSVKRIYEGSVCVCVSLCPCVYMHVFCVCGVCVVGAYVYLQGKNKD